jgi:hypothetical protein
MEWNLEEECTHIKVEQFIKVNGLKIENQDLVFILMLINKNIKEIGLMVRNMEKELITIKMEIFILANG